MYAVWGYKPHIRKLGIKFMKNANLSNFLPENQQFQSILCADREPMFGDGTSCFSSEFAFSFFLFSFGFVLGSGQQG